MYFVTYVIIEQESYKSQKGLPEGGFLYHISHVYAPAVLQNLLSEDLHVEADVSNKLSYIHNLLFTLHNVQSTCLQHYIIFFI